MKRNLRNWIFILQATFFLTGCFGLFDSGSGRIIGKYIVLWIDLSENQTVSEESEMHSSNSSEIVPPYVFAVGHNKDFIIVKQHPTNGFEGNYKINTSVTNFYIIDINKKIVTKDDNCFGPLTKYQFDNLRAKLKIVNISFNMNYPDKP